MRKLALDVGDVRIGLATSDIMGIIASGYETYTRKSLAQDYAYIADFCKKNSVDTLVIGLPVNMDGTEGPRVEVTREFANGLQEYVEGIKIVYQDERLTTVQAERMLIQGGVRREKRKKVIDKVAATIILQAYLDRINY
ncbi:MAG: Holliday junction resolvase RuvX [Clostridia bacterium]|nr:Holliday junction resolvase RuvX [Clostridia bacterium]